ncbi:MAG: hypothetical protein ACYS4W_00625 [Planctomycetota bacterium]|jgi:hypothetical protein
MISEKRIHVAVLSALALYCVSCSESPEKLAQLLRASDSNDFASFCDIMGQDLTPGLQLVHDFPYGSRDFFDPVGVVRTVNGLHELGMEKATDALTVYTQLVRHPAALSSGRGKHDLDERRVILILRLLFVPKEGGPQLPPACLGAPLIPPITPAAPEDWPLYPLALVDDIPFNMVSFYLVAGWLRPSTWDIKFCRTYCKFRDTALFPTSSPLMAVEKLMASERWKSLFAEGSNKNHEPPTMFYIRKQALVAISDIYDTSENEVFGTNPRCAPPEEEDSEWDRLITEIMSLNLRWDPTMQAYVVGKEL